MRNERRRLLAKYSSASDEQANDRLVKPLRVSKKMRPFVRRMRLRRAEIDLGDPALALQFEQGREEMRRILVKKKIPDAKIKRAIEETLAIAANYRLQAMRELDVGLRNFLLDAERIGVVCTKYRTAYANGWSFPPLTECREAFAKLYGPQDWDNSDADNWRL